MISARNRIKGVVKKVEKGTVAAVVKVVIEPAVVTAMITKEAVDELDIEEGDEVQVVIKATEVMVLKGSD